MLEKGTVVFGNWTVESEIGSGAFGTVYKIKREDFGEEYFAAMKVIRIPQDKDDKSRLYSEGMSDEDISLYYKQIAGDFIKEIKLLSSLDGVTNIVDYKDHVIEPNDDLGYTIYIKMQLLTPVSKLLVGEGNKAKFLNSEDIIRLGKDMCSALEVCEKKRIIHRDIKIDNIFVSDEGDYKLGDFGIARQLEATQGEMSKKGTLLYMAPEVFKGEKYDRTADIYSLGVVLYRLLNKNRAPFFPDYPNPIKLTDKESANAKRLKGDEFPDIASISAELNAVLKKACAYNPRDRYQSASDFRAALEGIDESLIAPVVIPPVADDTENTENDDTTVGIFGTAAAVPVIDIAGNDATESAGNTSTLDENDYTATQGIFAEPILSDTIFEKETVTIAEPDEKTESVFSAPIVNEKQNSKEPEDEKKKKGAIIIIIALILLIAVGVGIFFAVRHFSDSGEKGGTKISTTETSLSENDSANDTPVSTESTAFFVYLDLGNGEERKKFLMEEPGLVGMPPAPTREGYVFAGWYSDLGLTDAWNFTTDIATGEMVIYAKWVKEDDENIDDIIAQMPTMPDVDVNDSSADAWYDESDESVTLPIVTVAPTQAPTQTPTQAQTQAPTQAQTQAPTQAPTQKPTQNNITTEPTPVEPDDTPYLNSSGYYELRTADDLFWFAEYVNSGNEYTKAVLKNNINLNNRSWTPIDYFCGIFNGNGYTISGLYCITYDGGGLFHVSVGNISNLSVNGYINSSEQYAGGIVALNAGTVEYCTFTGTVNGTSIVGGIAGYNDYGSISYCTNNAKINGSDYLVGGITGCNYGTVKNCNNTGKVESSTFDVGGITGENNGTVESCDNSGNIKGYFYTGGIVGSNEDGIVKKCTNNGNVNSDEHTAGGVVGYNENTIDSCKNYGSVNSNFTVGGIAGANDGGTVKNCTNDGYCTGDDAGGVIGEHFMGSISNCSYYAYSANYGIGYCSTHNKSTCTHGVSKYY